MTRDWPTLTPAVADLIDAVAESSPSSRRTLIKLHRDEVLRRQLEGCVPNPMFAAFARFIEAVEIEGDLERDTAQSA